MAVSQTGAMYKSLIFDGKSSRSYGVYITGEAVYNAPEREVEMISIPGRNGQLALDKGRFENIEVTYPAGIYAETEADFAQAISDFRNFLCSRSGYVRLTDEYNPNEYRMAIYKSGLEVETALLRAGEFEIVFDCKPQRFLTSGETKQTIASSGDTITNPTLFDAGPLLEVTGYGKITLDGENIEIHNELIGTVILQNPQTYAKAATVSIDIDDTFANTGDTITVDGVNCLRAMSVMATVNSKSATVSGNGTATFDGDTNNPRVTIDACAFNYGTSRTETVTGSFSYVTSTQGTQTATLAVSLAYDGAHTFTLSVTFIYSAYITPKTHGDETVNTITLDSTKPVLGNPLYIDLAIGEAYKIESGSVVSVNNGVEIPAELPTLKSGANEITFDNTITDLKITPRWWKV